MNETADFIYENAPLIEVIAEFRWALVPLASMPGAAVDPFFQRASGHFTEVVGKAGFSHVERLIPPEVPLEVVAYQPVFRYRREANIWPLFQIGPGLMSCNITPPYAGWADFRKIIETGLRSLDQTFRINNGNTELNMIQVRYINGFTAKHGMINFGDFCKDDLNLGITLPPDIATTIADPQRLTFAANFGFPLAGIKASSMEINCAQGQSKEEPAAILQLSVIRQHDLKGEKTVDDALVWMGEAHKSIRGVFKNMTSQKLKNLMGPMRPVILQ